MNIGQVSKTTGVSQRMIRHYESIGLMPPADRRDYGYRNYPPRLVERQRFKATPAQIASTKPNGHAPCKKPYAEPSAHAAEKPSVHQ